jgi:hypothetical protein
MVTVHNLTQSAQKAFEKDEITFFFFFFFTIASR